jgi:hypothetical protein
MSEFMPCQSSPSHAASVAKPSITGGVDVKSTLSGFAIAKGTNIDTKSAEAIVVARDFELFN